MGVPLGEARPLIHTLEVINACTAGIGTQDQNHPKTERFGGLDWRLTTGNLRRRLQYLQAIHFPYRYTRGVRLYMTYITLYCLTRELICSKSPPPPFRLPNRGTGNPSFLCQPKILFKEILQFINYVLLFLSTTACAIKA